MGRCLWELQLWETPAQGRGWAPPNASQGRPGMLGAAHGPPSPAEPQCPRCSSPPSSCPLVLAGRPRQRREREVRGAGPWHFWPHPQMGNFSLLHQFCLNLKRRWRHPPPRPRHAWGPSLRNTERGAGTAFPAPGDLSPVPSAKGWGAQGGRNMKSSPLLPLRAGRSAAPWQPRGQDPAAGDQGGG